MTNPIPKPAPPPGVPVAVKTGSPPTGPGQVEPEDLDLEDDEPDAYTPPDEAEWSKVQKRLTQRGARIKRQEAELAALRAEISGRPAPADPAKAAPPKATSPEDDSRLRRHIGIAALASEGMTRDQAKAAVALLDLSGIDLTEDDPDLEDEIAALRERFPALFAPTEAVAGRRVPKVTTAPKGGRVGDDPDKVFADRLLGRSR